MVNEPAEHRRDNARHCIGVTPCASSMTMWPYILAPLSVTGPAVTFDHEARWLRSRLNVAASISPSTWSSRQRRPHDSQCHGRSPLPSSRGAPQSGQSGVKSPATRSSIQASASSSMASLRARPLARLAGPSSWAASSSSAMSASVQGISARVADRSRASADISSPVRRSSAAARKRAGAPKRS